MNTLYSNPSEVARLTRAVTDAGYVTFQLYMLDRDERTHAQKMLELAKLPPGASVLSLGCGVGGMEWYWSLIRPDLSFTLVNISQEQLDMTVAPGQRVLADAETYEGPLMDCVLIAYMLGHANARATVDRAKSLLKPGGRLLVWDIFHVNAEFEDLLEYARLELDQFSDLRRVEVEAVKHPVADMMEDSALVGAVPALLLYEAPL